MELKESRFAYFRRLIFRGVAGLLVVAVVSAVRFVYSVSTFGSNETPNPRLNKLTDKALGDKVAIADVMGGSCGLLCNCNTCQCGTCSCGSCNCGSGCGGCGGCG